MLAATALFAVGCDDDNDNKGDSVAPAPISDVTFTPQPGGGYFLYTNPKDADFVYDRVEYTIRKGEKISKTSSAYSDTLFIEGFGEVKEYEVKLYAVDRNNNVSEPVIMKVTPLETATETILSTMDVISGFSSLNIKWENETQARVNVYVKYEIDGKEGTKVQASNAVKDNFEIDQLEGRAYNISIWLTDNYGNQSSVREMGQFTPKEDYLLDKTNWSFLQDSRLWGNKWDDSKDEDHQAPFGFDPNNEDDPLTKMYAHDSLKNGRRTYYEGRATYLIDGELDDAAKLNLNYSHSGDLSWNGDKTKGDYGQGYDFGAGRSGQKEFYASGDPSSYNFYCSYYFDLGETVQASRIQLSPRLWGADAWGTENCKEFQIFISNDQDPTDGITGWEYVGHYAVVKPSDDSEANLVVKEGGPTWLLYPDDPRFTPPFRYIRYKVVKIYGGNSVCTSELTLWGQVGDSQPYAPTVTPDATPEGTTGTGGNE